MKKKFWLFFIPALLLAGHFTGNPAAARMNIGGARQISNAIHQNARQSLRPHLNINSSYAVPVMGVKVSPDGHTMAMLGSDNRVHLWNLQTGQKFYSFHAAAEVANMSFPAHEQRILITDVKGAINSINFNGESAKPKQKTEMYKSSKILAFHPDGKILACAGSDQNIELWQISHTGELAKIKTLPNPKNISRLAFSGDGSKLLSADNSGRLLYWNWQKEKIDLSEKINSPITAIATMPAESIMAIASENGQLYLLGLSQNNPIAKLPKVAALQKNCLTGLTFVSSGSPYLIGCSRNGNLYKWEVPSGNLLLSCELNENVKLNGVASIPGLEYFFSAGEGRFLRLCSLASGKEVAKLVVLNEGWGAVSANGCFDGTLKNAAEDHLQALNWTCNNQELALDGFLASYYRPALLGRLLTGITPEPQTGAPDIENIASVEEFPMPPTIQIIKPAKEIETSEQMIEITLKAADQGSGIHDIRLYHNGNIVDDQKSTQTTGEKNGEVRKTYKLSLLAGANQIKAVALNDALVESTPDEILVTTTWSGPKPRLHIVTVGISKYDNHRLDLNFSRQDAEKIGQALLAEKSSAYSEIILHHLYDDEASRTAINKKLEELINLPPQDTVVIYMAGHGETLDDEWFFIPHELRHPENKTSLKENAISSSLLELSIAQIGARRIFLILDACKSGALVNAFANFDNYRPMALLSRLTGIHVISATTRDQYAGEFGRLGHGLFTYSLLEGLQNRADNNPKDGNISVSEIMSYVETQMPILIERHALPVQNPLINSHGEDFPIAANIRM
ncbi:MAG: caspase family protein [Deltaproteobacteria bacterium]|nr:caspase family protein [Deltaproteobacteria bacterium]